MSFVASGDALEVTGRCTGARSGGRLPPRSDRAGHWPDILGQTDAMPRPGAVYEIVNPSTGEVLSRHRTRQAAVDTWRTQFTGVPVQVWRRTVPKGETLIVEGTWHESHRPG